MRRRRRINGTSHDFNIKAILIDNKARAGVKIITRRKIHSDTATSRGARKLRKMYEEYAGTDSNIFRLFNYVSIQFFYAQLEGFLKMSTFHYEKNPCTLMNLTFDSCQMARKV